MIRLDAQLERLAVIRAYLMNQKGYSFQEAQQLAMLVLRYEQDPKQFR